MTEEIGPKAETSADEALDVQTVVVEERGRWAVDIVVVFADGVVRKRIDTHATKARADIAADLIRRAANRDIGGGPPHG
ncbi:MAG: hypothetical protein U0R66_01850 [Mycobacterium sp.]